MNASGSSLVNAVGVPVKNLEVCDVFKTSQCSSVCFALFAVFRNNSLLSFLVMSISLNSSL